MIKKIFSLLICFVCIISTIGQTHGLSFHQNTMFLDIKDKTTCEDAGAFFTERYGEIYCTLAPYELSEEEMQKIDTIGTQLLMIIGENDALYEYLKTLLETYTQKFIDQKDTKKYTLVREITAFLWEHREI